LRRMDWWSGDRKGFRWLSGNVGPTRVYSNILLIPWGKKGQRKGELLGITPFDRYQFTVKLKHPGLNPYPGGGDPRPVREGLRPPCRNEQKKEENDLEEEVRSHPITHAKG